MRVYLAIDNGTSGTICMMKSDGEVLFFLETPIKEEQSYTKTKQIISRIDVKELTRIIRLYREDNMDILAIIERPLVNPKMFRTTMSAMRSLEATLCILESLDIGIQYVDSKEWQKVLLPSGIKGSPELKKASLDIASRLFPKCKETINKHGDGDALLIAEWARRSNL